MALEKLPGKMYPGFGLSMLDSAVKESFAKRCTKADLGKIRAFFTHDGAIHCAYCDAPDPKRWDHIHPVSRGGDTTPGNLVPACGRCDDSKQDREIKEWASSKSKHRPQPQQLKIILDRIEEYRATFSYSPIAFDQKLSGSQKAIYDRFRTKLEELRSQLKLDGLTK
jgi:hypothetical protein